LTRWQIEVPSFDSTCDDATTVEDTDTTGAGATASHAMIIGIVKRVS
jgi:hypothetical protein